MDLKILKKSSLFQGFTQEELASLLDCLKPRTAAYEKNQSIAAAGDVFASIGILLSGEAAVYRENAAGNRVMIIQLVPGDLFGEMLAFSGNSTWPVTVVAQESADVLFLGKQMILGECGGLCPWHRSLIENLLKILSEKALFLNRKVEYLSIKSMRGKIATYLLEQSEKTHSPIFMLPFSRNDMADFLNVSRPSMSREMARMRKEGIIDYHLATIRILNMDTLKALLQS